MPNAAGQGKAKIPIVSVPELSDGNDQANRRSRRSGSGKKEKDLSYNLFDCHSKVPNAGGKYKGNIAVLPMSDFPDGKYEADERSRRRGGHRRW